MPRRFFSRSALSPADVRSWSRAASSSRSAAASESPTSWRRPARRCGRSGPRTGRPQDFRRALDPEVALILTVHPSNYEIRGFAASPTPAEIAEVAREGGIPWVHDQGTGCVVALDEFGVPGETTVAECLAAGADLVTFSGDKLFSGPQAGLVVGKAGTGKTFDMTLEFAPDTAKKNYCGCCTRCIDACRPVAGLSDLPRGGRRL